jgi:hypothetical protein
VKNETDTGARLRGPVTPGSPLARFAPRRPGLTNDSTGFLESPTALVIASGDPPFHIGAFVLGGPAAKSVTQHRRIACLSQLRKPNRKKRVGKGRLDAARHQRVVPVMHGANATETDCNCRRIKRLYPAPSIIGIGGLVPTLQKCGSVRKSGTNTPQQRIADSVRCVQAHFPRSRIHLFGVGSLHTVLGVVAPGARSVDSIGWRQAAGFGSVYIP